MLERWRYLVQQVHFSRTRVPLSYITDYDPHGLLQLGVLRARAHTEDRQRPGPKS